jgi:hypothetical protein
MNTSAECRKIAAAKIGKAEGLRDQRRANRLIRAAKAWLILADGVRSFERGAEAYFQSRGGNNMKSASHQSDDLRALTISSAAQDASRDV